MTLEHQVLTWNRYINVAGLNTLIRSQPSVLKTGFPIAIHIKNKTAQIGFHSKRPHTITQMNDISMEGTLEGSMDVRSYLTTS